MFNVSHPSVFHHSLVFSLRGRAGRNQSPVMLTGMALAHCILGMFLGVVCHCFPPPLDVPTFADMCLYVRNDARDPTSERWNCERERFPVILPKFRLPRKFSDLLHAANLRHGTDGFTSPPKECVLRISSPQKMRRLRPGLNPRTWVLKASTLLLDHRSRSDVFIYTYKVQLSTVWDRILVGTRFSVRPDQPWGPPSLMYNGYRVFPWGKVRPGRAADHSPPSSAAVMEE